MLQSRLVAGIIRVRVRVSGNWDLICQQSSSASQRSGDTQGYAPIPTNRTAYPAVHSTEPKVEHKDGLNPHKTFQDDRHSFTQSKPPIASSLKLAHTELGLHSKPNINQKRQLSTPPTQPPAPGSITEINCIGLDESPFPDDTSSQKAQNKAQNKAQEEDKKEYFQDHKASPLSHIEFADSRKPISQATDSNNANVGLILFTEEQQDTAEEALMRAMEIWKWNKIRGDPDSPHGKVLRELRGEFW